MALFDTLRELPNPKFSFGKSTEYHPNFSRDAGAACMYDDGFGLGLSNQLSPENKLRAVFLTISREHGSFIFNISGVDLDAAIAGFESYDAASDNNMITEWELSMILHNPDYLAQTTFHNGRTLLTQIEGGIVKRWN
ncbi:hypothetical protein MTO98_16135 [Mucilaginibacter sp. SMC90]|uniref:hypothetical protein n=1 Tax=Mucilaginibacter sp. SMC90 TaxID=2929803 RepID=UPI001FB2B3D3|nr:hypothetical protein [Mucilaginibacter sp. SMC90]UOE52607.1 hypothetical protein MTO98_16135 [Mucilaginibacter sp. SMC90]